ncbi:MAG: GNAT family N-acetyltransferase [Rikenellaceae bacterium]|jgi:ribosomal protein S18 acetylase RimI-like enzyme|nr:GNAT family N-acetyltransferase [Rikenellaceae bacterium]
MKIEEQKIFSSELGDALRGLCGQLYVCMPQMDDASMRALVESENSHLLILYADDGRPAGTTTVGVYRTPGGVRAWIEDVVVDGAFRGCGYGRALVEEAIALARRCGAATVALTSNPKREAANALYKSLGFTLYETNYYKMEL